MSTDRRQAERRLSPISQVADVTRLEHESLCRQMDEVLRMLKRIEDDLRLQSTRIAALETGIQRLGSKPK
jgi:hypothetical protein